jgi:hypothetical protein
MYELPNDLIRRTSKYNFNRFGETETVFDRSRGCRPSHITISGRWWSRKIIMMTDVMYHHVMLCASILATHFIVSSVETVFSLRGDVDGFSNSCFGYVTQGKVVPVLNYISTTS